MKKSQLCYEIPGKKNNFIAPQRFSDNQPEYDWNESQNLILRYAYPDFMPKGLITRLKNPVPQATNSLVLDCLNQKCPSCDRHMWWDYSDSRKVKTLKEALEQINEIAEALQDSQDGVMKKTAKTAMKIWQGTAAALPPSAAMVTICNQLPDLISKIF